MASYDNDPITLPMTSFHVAPIPMQPMSADAPAGAPVIINQNPAPGAGVVAPITLIFFVVD